MQLDQPHAGDDALPTDMPVQALQISQQIDFQIILRTETGVPPFCGIGMVPSPVPIKTRFTQSCSCRNDGSITACICVSLLQGQQVCISQSHKSAGDGFQ